ncbi:hypothetical protein [Salinicola sp. NYA28a]
MNIHDPRFKVALFIHRHGLKLSGVCLLVCLALVIADEIALSWIFTLLIVFMAVARSWTAKRYLEPVAQQIDDLFNAPGEDAIERFKSSATEFGVLGAFEDELDKLETVDFEGLNGAIWPLCALWSLSTTKPPRTRSVCCEKWSKRKAARCPYSMRTFAPANVP